MYVNEVCYLKTCITLQWIHRLKINRIEFQMNVYDPHYIYTYIYIVRICIRIVTFSIAILTLHFSSLVTFVFLLIQRDSACNYYAFEVTYLFIDVIALYVLCILRALFAKTIESLFIYIRIRMRLPCEK